MSRQRGFARERAIKEQLEADQWFVIRAAGSLGLADLVALRRFAAKVDGATEAWFIEVKSTAGGPYERFGPAARQALIDAANKAGGLAWLVWWPPRRPQVWIPASEWPTPRTNGVTDAAVTGGTDDTSGRGE